MGNWEFETSKVTFVELEPNISNTCFMYHIAK